MSSYEREFVALQDQMSKLAQQMDRAAEQIASSADATVEGVWEAVSADWSDIGFTPSELIDNAFAATEWDSFQQAAEALDSGTFARHAQRVAREEAE